MNAFPQFTTERLFIRHIQPADAELLAAYYWRNRDHLQPWEPLKDASFYEPESTHERINVMQHNFLHDRSVHFVAFTLDRQQIVGVCNFTGILRGVFQACYLGFSIGEEYQGQGLMQALLNPCIHYMFTTKGLHRIMANHLPHNTRSARLLHRLGFAREGYAKGYLKIAGLWQDHVLRAKVNPADHD
jgi:[ribosomal protein S5]-alanine N-acetyltransferase